MTVRPIIKILYGQTLKKAVFWLFFRVAIATVRVARLKFCMWIALVVLNKLLLVCTL